MQIREHRPLLALCEVTSVQDLRDLELAASHISRDFPPDLCRDRRRCLQRRDAHSAGLPGKADEGREEDEGREAGNTASHSCRTQLATYAARCERSQLATYATRCERSRLRAPHHMSGEQAPQCDALFLRLQRTLPRARWRVKTRKKGFGYNCAATWQGELSLLFQSGSMPTRRSMLEAAQQAALLADGSLGAHVPGSQHRCRAAGTHRHGDCRR